jgi:hypothetical protein
MPKTKRDAAGFRRGEIELEAPAYEAMVELDVALLAWAAALVAQATAGDEQQRDGDEVQVIPVALLAPERHGGGFEIFSDSGQGTAPGASLARYTRIRGPRGA